MTGFLAIVPLLAILSVLALIFGVLTVYGRRYLNTSWTSGVAPSTPVPEELAPRIGGRNLRVGFVDGRKIWSGDRTVMAVRSLAISIDPRVTPGAIASVLQSTGRGGISDGALFEWNAIALRIGNQRRLEVRDGWLVGSVFLKHPRTDEHWDRFVKGMTALAARIETEGGLGTQPAIAPGDTWQQPPGLPQHLSGEQVWEQPGSRLEERVEDWR